MSWLEGFNLACLIEFNDNIKKKFITLTFFSKKLD